MKTKIISEGKAKISFPSIEKLSKKAEIFYNPVMKTNRDLSIAVLAAFERNNVQIADAFAASGVRSIRFLKELPKKKIEKIFINDYSESAVQNIKKNLKQNKLNTEKRIQISQEEATLFLLHSNGFDYIDIDPFGTPVPFLDAAAKRIARGGILAVTATDTSALAGSFPEACRRKYGAIPCHGALMHEIGLRILIKKCQEIGAQYEKAFAPLFSYSKEHYMRVFFLCEKGRQKADAIVQQHEVKEIDGKLCGPFWTGQLWDTLFTQKLKTDQEESKKFLDTIKNESSIPQIGFYDIHDICKKNKLKIPQYAPLMNTIEQKGYSVARTHFSLNGMRSMIPEEELLEIIESL